MQSAKCGSTITRISTSRCWRGCSIGAAADTKPSATRFSFRRARFRDGPQTFRCPSTQGGSGTTRRAYAGSFRDGVEVPLATLFVEAARPFPPDAEGVDRARSATEGFLYRRLETLAATAGRFRLNAGLSIPFDGFSGMEVDLLCDKPRVVIELDGPQHLGDPVAYRRDRRKDRSPSRQRGS